MANQSTPELLALLTVAFEQSAWRTAEAILNILRSRISEFQYGY